MLNAPGLLAPTKDETKFCEISFSLLIVKEALARDSAICSVPIIAIVFTDSPGIGRVLGALEASSEIAVEVGEGSRPQ